VQYLSIDIINRGYFHASVAHNGSKRHQTLESHKWGSSLEEEDRLSHRLDRILERMHICRSVEDIDLVDKDIVNVCGGSGIEAEILLKQDAKSVVLCDIAQNQLRVARMRAQRAHLNGLECVKGDAENLPFCDGTFNLSYIHMALHHLPDNAKGITELCRVSDEVVIIDIMNALLTRLLNVLGLFTEEWCGITPNRMNGKTVVDLLEGAGMKPTITYFFEPPIYTSNRYIIRSYLLAYKAINSFVNRSKLLGLFFGNIAIISGLKQ